MGVAMLCCHVQWCSIDLSKNIITHTVFKNEVPDQEIVIDIFSSNTLRCSESGNEKYSDYF